MLRILFRKLRSIWNVFREYCVLAAVSNAVKTPYSQVWWKLGFSVTNVIIAKLRSMLLISNISALKFIKLKWAPLVFMFSASPLSRSLLSQHVANDRRWRKMTFDNMKFVIKNSVDFLHSLHAFIKILSISRANDVRCAK